MPQISPYLMFDGDCAEAMRLYERILGGKLDALITYGESPPEMPCEPQDRDLIMHARLRLDDQLLMASDSNSQCPYEGKKGFSLSLVYPTVSDAQRIFNALAEGGQVTMPLQKTFWAEIFGVLVDRHGTAWMISGGQMNG
ncbi:VOC family protein [Bordetella bronchiseptica]|uniref:VOC family protein n=1 Tax=Bordetella bronchiseptica TaxID=518 RepID=UPI0004612E3B|nr:VOC family protein [Bordetella bronchiseptica]KDD14089.1 3-demethylubiquinone-9 3-methyltransferase domain protein [Bordetella bronchiseptica MBORD707]